MIIAADFDGTLTTGEMGRGIGRYLSQNGHEAAYNRFFWSQLPRYLLARLGIVGVRDFKKRWALAMPRLFVDFSRDDLERMFESVVEDELWKRRREGVIAELTQQQANGYRVVIVSGSYQPLLNAFARRMNAEALGTDLEIKDGHATGNIIHPLNVGESKVQRLQAILGGEPLAMAYGDSMDDLPMLEMSETPIATYPDKKLREIALAKGWRILEG